MKTAYIFPGQGAQFVGAGKELYDNSPKARELFEKANEILGYRIHHVLGHGRRPHANHIDSTRCLDRVDF